jgi:Haem-degrading
MTRMISMIGAVGVALLSASAAFAPTAFAQVPSNPNNPNDTVPDTFTPPPYGDTINLETAKKAAAGATAEAKKRNWDGFCIAIVGPSGDLVYFEKLDNCQFASITISQHIARRQSPDRRRQGHRCHRRQRRRGFPGRHAVPGRRRGPQVGAGSRLRAAGFPARQSGRETD